ncbi:uncharacterized protein LOC129953816 [Eupeodes corollae]|uniref:uncharacterized protein LOC129953816 n=1 Tax=Eupeodes corollae TaxID=290404 RepID=UPI0024930242|nr:uncharacterized protein LOC129953816 [Eupeodes corollae]
MSLLEDFIFASDQLVEFHAAFKAKPSATHTVFLLEAYRNELQDLWRDCKTTYSQCIKSPDDEELKDSLSEVKAKYQSSSSTYFQCTSLISEFLITLKPNLSDSIKDSKEKSLNVSENEQNLHNIKVPACDTQEFHGNYLQWPSFRDMFTAVYINHSRLSDVQKLFHLRAKTKDQAFNIVNKFGLTDNNFKLAWNALKDQYENKRILVNNQIQILLNQQIIVVESGKEIKSLQSNINDALIALKSYDIDTNAWNAIIIYLCASRLPETTLNLWESSLKNPTDIPSWDQMNEFLSNRYRILESVAEMKQNTTNKSQVIKSTPSQNFKSKPVRNFHMKIIPACQVCSEQHPLRLCPTFLKMSVDDRQKTVRKHKFCFNCLALTHNAHQCQSTSTCLRCKGKHHTLLHFERNVSKPNPSLNQTTLSSPTVEPSSQVTTSSSSHVASSPPNISSSQKGNHVIQSTPITNHNVMFSKSYRQVLLATALVKIRYQGTDFDLRALIDQGSEVSFISEKFQKCIGLPTSVTQARICGMGSTETATSSKLCTFTLCSNNLKEFKIHAEALVLNKLTCNLPAVSLDLGQTNCEFDFPLADPLFYQSSSIDMLIGADLYPHIILEGIKPNVLSSIMAQNTVFGWVLLGAYTNIPVVSTFSTFVTQCNELSADQAIERFWKLEELPQTPMLTLSEQFCEDLYHNTTVRDSVTGRYVVKLPFKNSLDESQLGHSRFNAMKQFLRNEKSLMSKPGLQEEYQKVLSEYVELGHMTPTPSHEIYNKQTVKSYYLPHHAVLKPQSTTTKLRVVFNASSNSSNGKSLNDLLHTGPVLQNDITFLILNWRFYKYVFNGDIEKMYRQIAIHPDHSQYQRILFRPSPSQPILDYTLNTVTFGVNCAPYLAIRTLHQLASDVQTVYPLASRILKKEFYVDDVLSGGHDIYSGRRSQIELIKALNSAGFHLRKWTANHPDLLNHIAKDDLLNKDFLKLEDDSSTKTLGIQWNASSDTFSFSITPESFSSSSVTKRSVLSTIAKLYDPAGWLAPIIITAKILMQQIWKDQTGWDENLSYLSEQCWKSFLSEFADIQEISIPRWIDFSPWKSLQLHGFSDASEKAYAATIYIRVYQPSSKPSSHLLWAKSKVAPVNTISLPRLELQGAVLLSRMIKQILNEFDVLNGIPIKLWTDSTIVLSWLDKSPSTWKTYIANRASEILSNVNNLKWNHVSSPENPADLATRGVSPKDLQSCQLWWNGPAWLVEQEENWPSHEELNPSDEFIPERKPIQANVALVSSEIESEILCRFSSWDKAVRVLSYIFRFYNSARKLPIRSKYISTVLLHEEIKSTKLEIIKLTQKQYFSEEYEALVHGTKLKPRSSLLTLNPILDTSQIMRSHGRLASSTLSYNERFPIILPYQSHLSTLLIAYIHKLTLHGEIQLMIRIVRSEYWIPKLKTLIKKCIRTCKPCILYKQSVQSQIMGALPVERTLLSLPFTNIGIDFAGPFTIRNYYGRKCRLEKGYACLFVCFATKAIHLEAVSDLSTPAFLASFTRFVARRGFPAKVYTDNGTNFVGASKLLMADFQQALNSYPGSSSYNFSQISWNFIPPGSPHMGGLWEAGVKSFKIHFKKIAGNSKYTFEEFSTLLARIESCLNSRPLSSMSNNPDDLLPLTPGHFLRGGPLLSPPEPSEAHKDISFIRRWNTLKIIHHQFSIRWKEEYLKELLKRYKWKYPKQDMEVGDLVVLRHEQLPPNEWRLGRVIKVHRGPDSKVRVADVKTQNGVVTRSIVKLCVLPFD